MISVGAVVSRSSCSCVSHERRDILPTCPIYALTGLRCPGCGGTHCLIALLHGHMTSAWHSNALLTVLLPAAVVLLLVDLAATAQGHPSPAARLANSRPLLWSLATVTVLFGIGRNLL